MPWSLVWLPVQTWAVSVQPSLNQQLFLRLSLLGLGQCCEQGLLGLGVMPWGQWEACLAGLSLDLCCV